MVEFRLRKSSCSLCRAPRTTSRRHCDGVARDAVQIMGGTGCTKDEAAEKFTRDAKVFQIWEGTSQIQRLVISRDEIGEPECARQCRPKRRTEPSRTSHVPHGLAREHGGDDELSQAEMAIAGRRQPRERNEQRGEAAWGNAFQKFLFALGFAASARRVPASVLVDGRVSPLWLKASKAEARPDIAALSVPPDMVRAFEVGMDIVSSSTVPASRTAREPCGDPRDPPQVARARATTESPDAHNRWADRLTATHARWS